MLLHVHVSFLVLKLMPSSYLVSFVTASVQNIRAQLSLTCLVRLIEGTDGHAPPSLTVNISVFITGQTGFSVQTGHGGVKHLIVNSRWRFATILVGKTSTELSFESPEMCFRQKKKRADADLMISSQSWRVRKENTETAKTRSDKSSDRK